MAGMSETSTSAKQWFVVHTYSGFENKVAAAIESRAKIFGLQDLFGRVIVPTEKVREIRKSKKIETEQKFFPGYLLVEMELTDDTWHLVRSTPKVTGFVGSGAKPVQGEHIFASSQLTPLAVKWKELNAAKRHKEAMEVLEQIIKGSTAMFERLAQYEDYHYTVDLSILVDAARVGRTATTAGWRDIAIPYVSR